MHYALDGHDATGSATLEKLHLHRRACLKLLRGGSEILRGVCSKPRNCCLALAMNVPKGACWPVCYEREDKVHCLFSTQGLVVPFSEAASTPTDSFEAISQCPDCQAEHLCAIRKRFCA